MVRNRWTAWAPAAAWLAVGASAAAATPLEGRWEGTGQIEGAPMAIVVDLAPASSPGAAGVGSVTLPGRGIKGAALTDLQVHDDTLRCTLGSAFTMPVEPAPAVTLRATGDRLVGEFQMNGLTAALALRRSGAAQVDLPPASTPISDTLAGAPGPAATNSAAMRARSR